MIKIIIPNKYLIDNTFVFIHCTLILIKVLITHRFVELCLRLLLQKRKVAFLRKIY